MLAGDRPHAGCSWHRYRRSEQGSCPAAAVIQSSCPLVVRVAERVVALPIDERRTAHRTRVWCQGNYHRFFGRGSHHFVFKGAHFTLLDDASATIAPQAYEWLDGWLQEGRDAFHSVYMHLPPLDVSGVRNGAMASRAEADLLLSKLAGAGVDLTVYGHVHTYYAYTNAGIPAFITGGGGAIPVRFDHVGRHFLAVDIDPGNQRLQTAIVRVD